MKQVESAFKLKDFRKPRIMSPTESYVTRYPQFVELANTQIGKCFWTSTEIKVEKDKQDMLVNMSPAAAHAVMTTLKLFVKYELFAGDEYWGKRVMSAFPRPEIRRMASTFQMFELAVHAPFYDELNKVLGNHNDEFYLGYVNDPVLSDRVKFLESLVDSEDDLLSVGMFSMMEGALLFSAFAIFKNFQSNGNNLLNNVARGINQSVIDEGLHQTAGAMLFRETIKELYELGIDRDHAYFKGLHEQLKKGAATLYEHECRIIDMLFEKGPIKGITAEGLKAFVRSRINICLTDLGVVSIFEVGDNPVADWFYSGVQMYQMNDFFVGIGREYTRDWNEKGFVWKTRAMKEAEVGSAQV